VIAQRLNCVAGMNSRVLSENPSEAVPISPSAAEMAVVIGIHPRDFRCLSQ